MKHYWHLCGSATMLALSLFILATSRDREPPREAPPVPSLLSSGYAAAPTLPRVVTAPEPALSESARLAAALDRCVVSAGREERVFLKIGLTGRRTSPDGRPPVNLAFVIDRSGSMKGDKIAQAREGAVRTIRSLGRDDIVAVIAFDSRPEVVVPATRLDHREPVIAAIEGLREGGNTALHAGVARGAEELRPFVDPRRLSRVILLSDGLANVGPSSPGALAALGETLRGEGISVTTLGIGAGYNEDLMTRLAAASDGNHMFVWGAPHLAEAIRQETDDALSAVAQDVSVHVRCEAGFVPVRALNRGADIAGGEVVASWRQLYADQEKYLVLELSVPPLPARSIRRLAAVEVTLTSLASGLSERLEQQVMVGFSSVPEEVAASTNRDVTVAASLQMGVSRSSEATSLRDAGRLAEARELLLRNAAELRRVGQLYQDTRLEESAERNVDDAAHLEGDAWPTQRKMMRAQQHGYGFVQAPEGVQKS